MKGFKSRSALLVDLALQKGKSKRKYYTNNKEKNLGVNNSKKKISDCDSLTVSDTNLKKIDEQIAGCSYWNIEPEENEIPTIHSPKSDFSCDDINDPDYVPEKELDNYDSNILNEELIGVEKEKMISTKKKSNYRWQESHPETWKQNKKSAQTKLDKKPKKGCEKCMYKCKNNFSEEERLQMCKEFWLLSYQRQKDFILKNVTQNDIKRRRKQSTGIAKHRNTARSYFLCNETLVKTRVCRNFFCATLSISDGVIKTAFKFTDEFGIFSKKDGRGTAKAYNKTNDEWICEIKNHIESFPVTESHYCRKTSKRMYLDATLSITKMYALFLKKYNEDSSIIPPTVTVYRKIFCTSYNLSFYHPKKDRCQICEKHKGTQNEKYLAHLKMKDECNAAKELDKQRDYKESNFRSCTFDLQSVLQIPSSDVSAMYYSRKLQAYNLAIYNSALPNDAFCYFWTELDAKKGSNEIGTCLYKYLTHLPAEITEVSLISDTCGGQNRNKNISCLLLFLVQTTNLKVIEQKFLQSGHTYMEVDSMHSAIETQKKNFPVYTIQDWLTIFRLARSKRLKSKAEPYNVVKVLNNEFLDLKTLSKIMKNTNIDKDEKKVNWLKVKSFRYQKSKPDIIEYRLDHTSDYKEINITVKKIEKNGKVYYEKGLPINWQTLSINKAYKKNFPISIAKKKDLLKLCKSEAIPEEYHPWYQSLKAVKNVKTVDSESDINDSDLTSSEE